MLRAWGVRAPAEKEGRAQRVVLAIVLRDYLFG